MVVVSKLQQWSLLHLRLLLPLPLPTVVSHKSLQSAERDEGSREVAGETEEIVAETMPAEGLIIKIRIQTRQTHLPITEIRTKIVTTNKGVKSLTRRVQDTAQMSQMTPVLATGRMAGARPTVVTP